MKIRRHVEIFSFLWSVSQLDGIANKLFPLYICSASHLLDFWSDECFHMKDLPLLIFFLSNMIFFRCRKWRAFYTAARFMLEVLLTHMIWYTNPSDDRFRLRELYHREKDILQSSNLPHWFRISYLIRIIIDPIFIVNSKVSICLQITQSGSFIQEGHSTEALVRRDQ